MGAHIVWPPSSQNYLDDFEEGGLKKPDFINRLVSAFYPNVFDGSPESEAILKEVDYYLFEQPHLESKRLEGLLTEACYTTLCGLKVLLQHHNLNVIELGLEAHKRRYRQFLEEELL